MTFVPDTCSNRDNLVLECNRFQNGDREAKRWISHRIFNMEKSLGFFSVPLLPLLGLKVLLIKLKLVRDGLLNNAGYSSHIGLDNAPLILKLLTVVIAQLKFHPLQGALDHPGNIVK